MARCPPEQPPREDGEMGRRAGSGSGGKAGGAGAGCTWGLGRSPPEAPATGAPGGPGLPGRCGLRPVEGELWGEPQTVSAGGVSIAVRCSSSPSHVAALSPQFTPGLTTSRTRAVLRNDGAVFSWGLVSCLMVGSEPADLRVPTEDQGRCGPRPDPEGSGHARS